MGKRISVIFLISLFVLFIFAGGALAAKQSRIPLVLPVDGAQPPEAYRVPSPVVYEGAKASDCEEIFPDAIILQGPDISGYTFYDYQKNGSMGRMIAVSSAGDRGMIWHETRGPYDPGPGQIYGRYVSYNCKASNNSWGSPTYIHGGVQINAGYANIMVMHDGREIVLDHRTAGTPLWYTCLLASDDGFPCSGYFTPIFDLADEHDFPTGEGNGYWPKGCIGYDADVDTDYIHVVTTEPVPAAGDEHTIAYQRCAFQGANLVCYSPGYGPHIRTPGVPYTLPSPIAVIDTTMTISVVAVSSPVSKKVAIVYTHNRDNYDTQVNNDIVYIESTNNGDDWLDGTQWPPIIYDITQYNTAWTERAYTDLAACYDYNDNLHILWSSCYYDSVAGGTTFDANLMHWTDTDPLGFDNATLVAPGYWDDGVLNPAVWNRILSKMSVAAKDPIYHPGGTPDSVFLFATWTQFNAGDNSAGGFTNGEIYAAVSADGGQTWARGRNLTNTQSDGCSPPECRSEHWSSLAENMYDGDLHIQYVCDRDAGGAVTPDGAWTDNDMIYIHVEQLESITSCGIAYNIVNPPSFTIPPLKVDPNGNRIVQLQVEGIYNQGGNYTATSNHASVTIVSGSGGFLGPGQSAVVEALITCVGVEEFVKAKITITGCIATADEMVIEIPIYAVCSDDYFECDRDPLTRLEKDNCKLRLDMCVNTHEEVWDKRIEPEDNQQVIFSGGVIVATTSGNDTVVGRQDYRDVATGAREIVVHDQGLCGQPGCLVQKVHVTNTYIWWTAPLVACEDPVWFWIDIHKQYIMFHDNPPDTCPNWKKEQLIKYVWIDWSPPPGWWPDPYPYTGHEDIYFGLYADVDAPFDTGCNGCNEVGYDASREMAWFHGYNVDQYPTYPDHYVGLAFTDPTGAVVAPIGCQLILNRTYLYPNDGWGWLDGELYELAATPGVNIELPDSLDDRCVVMTADYIPAGPEDDFASEYILIEASIAGGTGTGLPELQAHMDDTRSILIPELDSLGLFEKDFNASVCGDCNEDDLVNIADVVFLVNYLFLKDKPPAWPMECRGDVNNGDGNVDIADVVYLVNYLFLSESAPVCQAHCD